MDKLQLKVKAYKRQAEEAVSDPAGAQAWRKEPGSLISPGSSPHPPIPLNPHRRNRPTPTCPSSARCSTSWMRLRNGRTLLSPRSTSCGPRAVTSAPRWVLPTAATPQPLRQSPSHQDSSPSLTPAAKPHSPRGEVTQSSVVTKVLPTLTFNGCVIPSPTVVSRNPNTQSVCPNFPQLLFLLLFHLV